MSDDIKETDEAPAAKCDRNPAQSNLRPGDQPLVILETTDERELWRGKMARSTGSFSLSGDEWLSASDEADNAVLAYRKRLVDHAVLGREHCAETLTDNGRRTIAAQFATRRAAAELHAAPEAGGIVEVDLHSELYLRSERCGNDRTAWDALVSYAAPLRIELASSPR